MNVVNLIWGCYHFLKIAKKNKYCWGDVKELYLVVSIGV